MSYDQTAADLLSENEELHGQIHDLVTERASDKFVINQQATIIAIGTEHHDRVIARLLDGWQVDTVDEVPIGYQWRRTIPYKLELMSDGEAAIIRAHQEKTP